MSQPEHQWIAAGVFAHWADQFPLSVSTIYPGMQLDTSALAEWLEIAIDHWRDSPRAEGSGSAPLRDEDQQITGFAVVVQAFVKPALDQARVWELIDAARQTLAEQTITLRNYDAIGDPIVAYALLGSAEVRDHTRTDRDVGWHSLRHAVLTVRGEAREA